MKILLVRLSALGDVAQGLHVLATLKARRPDASVGWLVEDRFAALLEGHPQLDRLHVYRRASLRRWALRPWRLRHFGRLRREMRAQRYDLALDLQGNLKSGFLARCARAGRTLGTAPPLSREGHGLFVRERVVPPEGHRLDAYLALVDHALGPGARAPAVLPGTPSDPGVIILHPGTSRFGAFKKWPAERYAELGDRLSGHLDAPVLVTAGPGERAQAEEVIGRMRRPASLREPPDLRALVDLVCGARIVVATDTGPVHLAAAAGVPTVALYGPKDPDVFGPIGARVRAVRKGVRCSPCALRYCPDPVCMTTLAVDQVEREAAALLEGGP